MVLDELETQASRLGLRVSREPGGATLVVERGNGTTALIFESDGQLVRRTMPCWVPSNTFPGTSEQANLDWGMAVLLQYASGALAERGGERHDGPVGIALNNVSNVHVRLQRCSVSGARGSAILLAPGAQQGEPVDYWVSRPPRDD